MREHDFTLILKAEPDKDEADRIYGLVDDGTLSTIAGVPQLRFHREAPSLEDAIRSAIRHLRSAGFSVARIEIEPKLSRSRPEAGGCSRRVTSAHHHVTVATIKATPKTT